MDEESNKKTVDYKYKMMNLINLKITIRSLLKNKFYSTLSILGIAITFIFLTLTFIFIRQKTGNISPDVNRDRTISFSSIRLENGDELSIDSTLIKNYLRLKEPEYIAYLNSQAPVLFHNERTIQFSIGYVNADFFNIFSLDFLQGRALNKNEENIPVVMMSDEFAEAYYGNTDIVGQKLELQGSIFTVVGVFKKPHLFSAVEYGLFIPYKFDRFIPQRNLQHTIFLKAKSGESVEAMSDELNKMNQYLYQQKAIDSRPISNEWKAMNVIDETPVLVSLGVIISLLILIPAFNILSLNTGRIMDQTEELSIKKAYGASRSNIITELLFENVISTLIGALLGLILTQPFIKFILFFINKLSSTPISLILKIDYHVVIVVIITTFLFSLLSSIIPAWNISKKKIIEGLKRGKS